MPTNVQSPLPDSPILAYRIPHECPRDTKWTVCWFEADGEGAPQWGANFASHEAAEAFFLALIADTRSRNVERSCIEIAAVSDLNSDDYKWDRIQEDDEEALRRGVERSWA